MFWRGSSPACQRDGWWWVVVTWSWAIVTLVVMVLFLVVVVMAMVLVVFVVISFLIIKSALTLVIINQYPAAP